MGLHLHLSSRATAAGLVGLVGPDGTAAGAFSSDTVCRGRRLGDCERLGRTRLLGEDSAAKRGVGPGASSRA